MANNQWKSFQSPPLHNQDSASSIFDFKSMMQGSGNFRSITGAGANTGGGGGGSSSTGLGNSVPFGSSTSHSSYNHLNMSLFAAKNDLHANNSMFSSSSYNSSSASVPPPMNYNMFSNNNNSNNSR